MTLRTQTALKIFFATLGCLLWIYLSEYPIIGLLAMNLMNFRPELLRQKVLLGSKSWNLTTVLDLLLMLAGFALLFSVAMHLPPRFFETLVGTWYFTGIYWLILVIGNVSSYLKTRDGLADRWLNWTLDSGGETSPASPPSEA